MTTAARDHGPFDTEQQVRELPAVQAVYAAFRADPGVGKMQPHNRQMLDAALTAAGVELGGYDDQIAEWLSGWEPQMVAVIAGWITRAGSAELERGQHDHVRPGITEQRAVLATARAVLAGHDAEAHQAAGTGRCDACTVIAAASYGIMLAEQLAAGLVRKLAPGAEFDARPIRAQLLVMIAETERELRAAGN